MGVSMGEGQPFCPASEQKAFRIHNDKRLVLTDQKNLFMIRSTVSCRAVEQSALNPNGFAHNQSSKKLRPVLNDRE
jgi:hypothetical protein